jgi:hypothetical protein
LQAVSIPTRAELEAKGWNDLNLLMFGKMSVALISA